MAQQIRTTGASTNSKRRSTRWIWALVAVLVVGAIGTFVYLRKQKPAKPPKPAVPRVGKAVQITNDGLPKSGLVADRNRLYFNQSSAHGWALATASPVAGSSTTVLTTSIADTIVLDVSPESEFLASSGGKKPGAGDLWIVPAAGGELRRLNIRGTAAAWAPDGKIIFSRDRDLFRAEHDGSNPVKLASAPGPIVFLRVSLDGSRIRLTVGDPTSRSTIWEAHDDGSGMLPVLPLPGGLPQVCCGNWTPDGRYFVYEDAGQLWIVATARQASGRFSMPVQLTSGPLTYHYPVPSRDGRHLFAIGATPDTQGKNTTAQEVYTFDWQLP